MEPCGELLDTLWLRLLSSSPRKLLCIALGDIRPRSMSYALPFPFLFGRGELIKPNASPVISISRFCNFLFNACCSSAFLSASSSLIASSSSESVPSDDEGDVGSKCEMIFFGGLRRVSVEDDDAFFGRLGGWWPNELRRARTSSGEESRELESLWALPPMRLDVRRAIAGFSGRNGNSSEGLVVAEGLRAPLPVIS
jgi:hypothetical protein